jgi:hypothetical protein
VIGHLEVARGWVYKLREKSPQRWEWRLLILQDSGTLAYFCEGGDGALETRGLVRSVPFLVSNGSNGSCTQAPSTPARLACPVTRVCLLVPDPQPE